MKIAAMTMVYRDYWALEQWYVHYGQHLGYENLFIVAHGSDPKIAQICPKASIITVPRDELEWFDRTRANLLNGISAGLNNIYDWVIRTDTDELICLDPALHSDFPDFFSKCSEDAVFALGFDIIQRERDADMPSGTSVFGCRDGAVFGGAYSKAFAVCDSTQLFLHGVKLPRKHLETYPFQLPEGVYLAHVKFANLEALASSNEHRVEIAGVQAKGMPGGMWRKAHTYSEARFNWIEQHPEVSWDDAVAKAYAKITSEPKRLRQGNVIRAASVQFDFRTTLPAWFRTQYG